ncbi:hypothetical protein L2E82_12044 [Cichorium intybus]|uniref:Uncharacterized protein n=1 Tax=Cichorium intybus TaxID=13427 RepID=A0ACB9GG30_CICIN|nr:hypothetical protein L2E82_12044 [Cichorium intybus]
MESQRITEYERKRLENIKRNDELLASLKIHSKLADLSASTKRHREQTKSYRISPQKKAKSETPAVIRRSLRTQGKKPDSPGLTDDFNETPKKQTSPKSQVTPDKSARELKPLSMRDVSVSSEPDEPLVKKILSLSVSKQSPSKGPKKAIGFRIRASIDLDSMELMPENIARVVPGRILSVKFFPSTDIRMVVVGNKFGDLGFWNVDSETEDSDGIYMYRPHPAPISSICIQPFSMNKITTCCYHGLIRSLDVNKEIFDLTYTTEDAIYSMSQRPDDVNSLYFGEGRGVVCVWDERSKSSSSSWNLHDSRINSIDFNPENTNLMATSSSDGTACIWDLRKVGRKSNPNSLKEITRDRAVHSAYFSPSGSHLATTSHDDKIGVLSGANYDDEFLLYHYNQTGRWLSSFKGVWGWDDSYVFVGNMKRGVDVISTEKNRIVTTLESPHVTAIPCRFDAHPFKVGMLAGATSGGQVYIWS